MSLVVMGLFSGFASMVNKKGKPVQAKAYLIDVDNSQVFWRLDAHSGVIPIVGGKLVFIDDNLVDAHIKVHMDSLRNLDIDYKLMRTVLENTIKSKEVFQTEQYPYAFFRFYTSKKIAKDSLLVAGDLEIKEIENCIQFKTAVKFSDGSVVANTDTINVDRIRWGITSMSKAFVTSNEGYIISDVFKLQISLTAVLKRENK
ncbi:MAG: YceI family protein [Lentimicrobium sp.]|nr:YceI family protein [Lentimicrobium sp.]